MKKLYLSILALVLVGSFLMAIESEPSEIVGYVAYECVEGTTGNLNFISLPVMDAGAERAYYEWASDLGNAYPGLIDGISKWLPATQSWSTASLVGSTWFGDFLLDPANAYMISVTGPFTFYSVGALVDPIQYHLVEGTTGNLNFIMVPLDRSDFDWASELGEDIVYADGVSQWLALTQSWSTASKVGTTWFGDFGIGISKPLMVSITQETYWPSTRLETRN